MAAKKNPTAEMKKEATALIIKRAGTTAKQIHEVAINTFVANNVDLLTAAERKKYSAILL